MLDASDPNYPGWENFKSPRCRICGAEMVNVMAAYDSLDSQGKKHTEYAEELECTGCGKTAPVAQKYKYMKNRPPRNKKRQWQPKR